LSLPQFKLLRPRTVDEAICSLARHAGEGLFDSRSEQVGATRIIAGGTDLIPSMQQKLFEPEHVLDIRHIPELKEIRETKEGTQIGALTTLREIEHSKFLQENYPVLTQAAGTVASPVLRNMGTIGGNICLDTRCLWYNQSLTWRKACGFCIKKDGDLCHVAPGGSKCWAVFSGDTPAALLCLNAEIEIASASGVKRMPLREFYTGIGDDYRKLQPNELLTRVILPKSSAGFQGAYRKLRIRGSIDYPLAAVAVALRRSDGHISDARLALTAVNPAPVLVKGASELLAGKSLDEDLAMAVADLAAKTAKPLTTSALTPEYRREIIRVFTKRLLMDFAARPNQR
jgi:4-hydroxybenzoyl-CoA reductase subunit beta